LRQIGRGGVEFRVEVGDGKVRREGIKAEVVGIEGLAKVHWVIPREVEVVVKPVGIHVSIINVTLYEAVGVHREVDEGITRISIEV